MSEIVAVLDRPERIGPVLDVASAYAELLGSELVVYAAPEVLGTAGIAVYPSVHAVHRLRRGRPGWVASAAARPGVELVVVTATDVEHGGWGVDLLQECPASVLVVPDAVTSYDIVVPARVLVPLDGSAESTAAVTESMDLFATSGAEVVVLHVFDQSTAPAFWDQPVHAQRSWGEEFLARHVHGPGIRLELRTGAPGEEVVAVALAEGADLIALGWSRDLSGGRARTVRNAVGQASVPVLLVPLAATGRGRREREGSG
jgi:nucleotide-binding universal stress UspA family protein